MLWILGDDRGEQFCDGLSRRSFLQIGGLAAAGGLTLPDLLRSESKRSGEQRRQHKAIINIFLPGGPPHQDMFDLKMDAPADIRGEFKPISTNLPGFQICELFPKMAARSDQMIYILSLIHI